MSVALDERVGVAGAAPTGRRSTPTMFAPRVSPLGWSDTIAGRDEVLGRLSSPPFVAPTAERQRRRASGVALLLDWLGDQPGGTWQERWLASGADSAPVTWRDLPGAWLVSRGDHSEWRRSALIEAMSVAICADVVRPCLSWLVGGGFARGAGLLVRNIEACRDPDGFARLRKVCDDDPGISTIARGRVLYRSALIIAAKGGGLAEITVGDVIELFETEDLRSGAPDGRAVLYRMLHRLGIFAEAAPSTLRALRTNGQRTPDELIDRYHLACRPVRDLLVDYLRERQPALDYNSLDSVSNYLGKLFWADLELHHPGIADPATAHVKPHKRNSGIRELN